MSLLITADAGETKLQLIGRKAANLLRMRRADLPVPEFAVLTTAAAALALSGESTPTLPSAVTADRPTSAAEIRAAILNLSISDPVMGAIEQALRAVGRGSSVAPVAVRSSSLSEDAAAASFAGQFESFLAVDGLVNVAARIKDIWASCFNERVLSYRAQMASARRTGAPDGGDPTTSDLSGEIRRVVHQASQRSLRQHVCRVEFRHG